MLIGAVPVRWPLSALLDQCVPPSRLQLLSAPRRLGSAQLTVHRRAELQQDSNTTGEVQEIAISWLPCAVSVDSYDDSQ